jgi:putative ABC transport system substrate-binding protein
MLAAELVRRQVAVIFTPSSTPAALAAKAATSMIPIVFAIGSDPVRIGLVASLSRPGGNVTGITSMNSELTEKRVGLLRDLLPSATRIAVLVNPTGPDAEALTQEAQSALRTMGRPIELLTAATSGEIETAFATLVQRRSRHSWSPIVICLPTVPFSLLHSRRTTECQQSIMAGTSLGLVG